MDAAPVQATFSTELHPRAPKGSGTGGQFTSGNTGAKSTPPPKKTAPKSKRTHRRHIPHGQLGFDGVHGTGYGVKGGDPRVRTLQAELNRLGLLDLHGRRLAVDGKLGPLTTSSIKAAQRRLGMRATGIIAPAFIDRLRATKALPAAKPMHRRKPGGSRQSVRAKFDPTQPRDDHGRWSALAALADKFGEILESSKWGNHDGKNGPSGWITLHADGDVVISHRAEDGTAKAVLNGADIVEPSEWRDLAENLREAADAAEAHDEEFDDVAAPGYDINLDAEDGTALFSSDSRPKAGVVLDAAAMKSLADESDQFADHLERYNNGHYDAPDVAEPDTEDPRPPSKPDTFQSSGFADSEMDWSGKTKAGDHKFEVTGDDGGTTTLYMSPDELAGLRRALEDSLNGKGEDAYTPGGADNPDDGRYFDWSQTTGNADAKVYRLDIGDSEDDSEFASAEVEMTEADMRRWLASLTQTVDGKPVAAKGKSRRVPRRRRPVRAKFDPAQMRDNHGRWADQPGSAIVDTVRDWMELRLDHGNNDQSPVTAVVDTGNGRRLLLGFADAHYDAAEGGDLSPGLDSTVALDQKAARELDAAISDVQNEGRARQKQLTALYAEQDALNHRLGELDRPGERDPFYDPSPEAVAEKQRAQDRIAQIDEEINAVDIEDQFASGRIGTDGAVLTWDAWTDDGDDPDFQMHIALPGGELHLDQGDMQRARKVLQDAFPTVGPISAAAPVAAAEMRGIELARPGTWKLSSGPLNVTEQMLRDAERYANRKGARPGYVKIGHTDPRFAVADGEPALGWVENVRHEVDEIGPKLVGDIKDMPDWFAAAARKHWPYRSIEGWADFTDPDTGEKFGLVVDGLALLGVTPPGMTSLKSLRDLPPALGVTAASGTRVVASMASAPVAVEEGAGHMDPAKTREALGLAADAPDDEVRSAMQVALQSLGGDAGPAQQPVQASLFGDDDPAPKPKAPVVPPGAMLVSASAWQEREETIKKLTEFVAESKRNDRDAYIATAVKAGKFTPAQKIHFTKMWDADPDTTRAYIDSMTPNSALAVMASGYAGDLEEADIDREFAGLFPPVHQEAHRG